MHILLIGTGYVGMALLSSWGNSGDGFLATTTTPEKIEEIRAKRFVEDAIFLEIKRETDTEDLLSRCDAVIVTVAPKKGAGYRETYLETALCLRRAVRERTKPLFLLYTSSTSVYGNHEGEPVDETSERMSLSESGKVLAKAEDLFLSCEGPYVDVCLLRLGGIYGPSRTLGQRARRMSGRELGGTGQEPTNHIHLDDIISAIAFCVANRLSGIYNLVNDDHPSRLQLYNELCKQLNLPPPDWLSKGSPPRSTNARVSNEKIKKAGYLFRHPHLSQSSL